MIITIEGKEVEFNVFEGESFQDAASKVFGLFGLDQCPVVTNWDKVDYSKTVPSHKLKVDMTVMELAVMVSSRFEKSILPKVRPNEIAKRDSVAKQVILPPEAIVELLKMSFSSVNKNDINSVMQLDSVISEMADVVNLNRDEIFIKMFSESEFEVLDKNKTVIYSVLDDIIYVPPIKVIEHKHKPLQKSIDVECAVVEETTATESTVIVDNSGEKETIVTIVNPVENITLENNVIVATKLKTSAEIAEEKLNAKAEKDVINNMAEKLKAMQETDSIQPEPAQEELPILEDQEAKPSVEVTIEDVVTQPEPSKENTVLVMTRSVDIKFLEKYVDLNSLKCPLPLKKEIMVKLETVFRNVLKDGTQEQKKAFLGGKKYKMHKATFFGKDIFVLFNGRHYLKVKGEDANFTTELNS